MAQETYVGSLQTLHVSTGRPETVNDPFDTTKPNNGARNNPGVAEYVSDGTITGRRWKVRYVRLNSTTTATLIVGPVYWKDNTFQVVTIQSSEAIGGINNLAGILLNANATNGNWVFVLAAGFIGAANIGSIAVPALTASGDLLIGATGAQQFARVAIGSNRTNVEIAMALTAVSGGVADIFVQLES